MADKPLTVRGVGFPPINHALHKPLHQQHDPASSEGMARSRKASSAEAYTLRLSPISQQFQEIYSQALNLQDPAEREKRLTDVQHAAARFAETGDERLIEPFLGEQATSPREPAPSVLEEEAQAFWRDLLNAGFEMERWQATHEGLDDSLRPLHLETSDALLSHDGDASQRATLFNRFTEISDSFLQQRDTSLTQERFTRLLHTLNQSASLEQSSALLRELETDEKE